MTQEEFEKLSNCTICGYSLNELMIFADACRKQNISNYELKEFCVNVEGAYAYVMSEIGKSFNEEIERRLKNETDKR